MAGAEPWFWPDSKPLRAAFGTLNPSGRTEMKKPFIRFHSSNLFVHHIGMHKQAEYQRRDGTVISIDEQLRPLIEQLDRLGYRTLLSCWGSHECRILFADWDTSIQLTEKLGRINPKLVWYFMEGGIKHARVNVPTERIENQNQWDACDVGGQLATPEQSSDLKLVIDVPHKIFNNFVECLQQIP